MSGFVIVVCVRSEHTLTPASCPMAVFIIMIRVSRQDALTAEDLFTTVSPFIFIEKTGQEMVPAPYMKACPRFCYSGSWLSLPFKGDDDTKASGLIGTNRNNTPAISSHTIHFFRNPAYCIGFDSVVKHVAHSCSGSPLFLFRRKMKYSAIPIRMPGSRLPAT